MAYWVCLLAGVSVNRRYCSISKIQETIVALDISVPSKTGGLAGLAADIIGLDLGSEVTGRLDERVLYSDVSESRSWY